MLHADLRRAHADAMADLRTVDHALGELLERRRRHLADLDGLRRRLVRPRSYHGGRRRPLVDEAPLPPAPDGAEPLSGLDLRAVCLRLLARHGPHRLRDLHGLLHCHGYVVAGPHPVKLLADAMAYEVRCGRARRVERAVYAAVDGATVPRPRWLGPEPPSRPPLPWSRPVTEPGPPLIDQPVALDPILWGAGGDPPPDQDPPPGDPGLDPDSDDPDPTDGGPGDGGVPPSGPTGPADGPASGTSADPEGGTGTHDAPEPSTTLEPPPDPDPDSDLPPVPDARPASSPPPPSDGV